jgi:hypothetical protein
LPVTGAEQQPNPWVREGDLYRCVRHAVTFKRTETCAKCESDPPPAPDAKEVEQPFTAPKGCLTGIQVERAMVVDLTLLRRLRNGLARSKNKTHRDYNAIAKLTDSVTKLLRALADRAQGREDNELVDRRERRWMASGASKRSAH